MAAFVMVNTDHVYTLADLEKWDRSQTWFAVLGHPIKHSISPAMHNAALSARVGAHPEYRSWHYLKFDIEPEQLGEALKRFRDCHFLGLNLTLPHKVLALDCIHAVDAAAQPAGAVNTLRLTPEGWVGHNTDGLGMSAGIRRDLGVSLRGAQVLLLGAGGAARAAAVQCLQEGVASLTVGNRSRESLDLLMTRLRAICPDTTRLDSFLFEDGCPPSLPSGTLVINSTSAGLKALDPLPIDLTTIPRPSAVYDMIYNPAKTELLKQAEALGLPIANGLSMLVNQGAKALSLWTSLSSDDLAVDMARAAEAAMRR